MNFKMNSSAGEPFPTDELRDLAGTDIRRPVMPFDLRELDKLPQPTDDDPPYRPWWVVDRS